MHNALVRRLAPRTLGILLVSVVMALTPGLAWQAAHAAPVLWNPVVASNSNGRLEVFASSDAGDVWHKWQDPNLPGGWSGWLNLGKPPVLPSDNPVTVGRNKDGRLEIFKNINGGIYHAWQDARLPGGWSGWADMGCCFAGRIAPIGSNQDGRLEVYTSIGPPDLIEVHNYQTFPGGGWSDWWELGAGGMTATAAEPFTVANNLDGRLEVFALDPQTGNLWQVYQIAANSAWSRWYYFGQPAVGTLSYPTMARNKDGRLEVFLLGDDLKVHHRWQLTAGGAWSGWASLGGDVRSIPFAVANADGRLEVFGLNGARNIVHAYQLSPGGAWSGWTRVGNDLRIFDTWISVGRNASGRLEAFAGDTSGRILRSVQSSAGWSNWAVMA